MVVLSEVTEGAFVAGGFGFAWIGFPSASSAGFALGVTMGGLWTGVAPDAGQEP